MKKKLITGLATGLLFVIMTGVGNSTVIYENDFESGTWSEWTSNATYTTSTFTTLGNSTGLGKFLNGTVGLSLSGLGVHDEASISFELYINNSWDGDNSTYGPDNWGLEQDGSLLLATTFSNVPSWTQAYAGNGVSGGVNAYRTGASDFNEDGFYGHSVYEISYTFQHTSNTLSFDFSAAGLTDESWGLDNVVVSTNEVAPVPEPATMLLFGTGLVGLMGSRLRKKKK